MTFGYHSLKLDGGLNGFLDDVVKSMSNTREALHFEDIDGGQHVRCTVGGSGYDVFPESPFIRADDRLYPLKG